MLTTYVSLAMFLAAREAYKAYERKRKQMVFINDRAWNLKQAKARKEYGDWHVKRATEALRRGDMTAYKDHMRRSKPYFAEAEAYMASARKSTK